MRKLIDDYKFEYKRATYRVLAELLSERIGIVPPDVTIVPIPTIAAHIRERGYDHMLLVARHLAKLQKIKTQRLLERLTRAQQRGAGKATRTQQAKEAFAAKVLTGGTFLLIDDIVTTGATLHYGAKTLLDAGADEVWVAALCRQPSTRDG